MQATLERKTFEISRALEFFSEKELQMQIGFSRSNWAIALTKELIDNSLDAAEMVGISPEVEITVEDDWLCVQDNGPGLPLDTIDRSLDYAVRVSDKSLYVSPTRGQLGNALKCIWAAPFIVSNSEHGLIEIHVAGVQHRIAVTLDRIKREPSLKHDVIPGSVVKNGTLIKMHWPSVACYLGSDENALFYRSTPDVHELLRRYAAFNPHATFILKMPDGAKMCLASSNSTWDKWRPDQPISAHWYTPEKLRDLIAAYLGREETQDGKYLTVRAFISSFAGLKGTAKQRAVTEAMGLSRASLRDLVRGDDIDMVRVRELLTAMQAQSNPVKPERLGVLGKTYLSQYMVEHAFSDSESVVYHKATGVTQGLPYVLEVGFGVNRSDYEDCGRALIFGLNWSPALKYPPELLNLVGGSRVDSFDPVTLVVHLACPSLDFTEHGKGSVNLLPEIRTQLEQCVESVTKKWKKAAARKNRENRMRERDLEELRKSQTRKLLGFKDAACRVMEQAYLRASANGTYPANARQIMYAARPLIKKLTGGEFYKNTSSFTQQVLPDFIKEHPELTRAWDVVFDARGKLTEPHTGKRVDLGTVAVRQYINAWTRDFDEKLRGFRIENDCPTTGPCNRFNFALFIEKEGFNELLQVANIARRFDIAIMSTKGMSVTASRTLIEKLSEAGVTVLVLHDFDKAGFSIVDTLRSNTRRYEFKTRPKVIDLGLRLDDVVAMGLESESVEYGSEIDPRERLRQRGATEDECNFLVQERRPAKSWIGERVELNAMASDQFIDWLEGKLDDLGVEKLVPGEGVLAKAYRRAWRYALAQDAIDKAVRTVNDEAISVPHDLEQAVKEKLDDNPRRSWDEALFDLVRGY